MRARYPLIYILSSEEKRVEESIRRVDAFRATELEGDDKVTVIRAYLRRWKMEVGVFFDGVGPDASDAELAAIAPGYPVFKIEPA